MTPEAIAAAMDGRLRPATSDGDRIEAFIPSPSIQNHAANLMTLPDGDLGCVWFGGTMEGMGDISIHFARLANGRDQWSAPMILSDDPERSEQNPVLFPAPDGRLWLFFTSQPAGYQDQALIKCRVSADSGKTFGPTETLWDVPGSFVRQPAIVRADGAWLLPIFCCRKRAGQAWRGDTDTSQVLISRDNGQTWGATDVPESLGAVHMNIVPKDRGLRAFFRDRYANAIQMSQSDEAGQNWSAPAPTVLPNNNSSIQAIRLVSGRIAMVYNDASAATSDARRASLYDEIDEAAPLETSSDASGPQAVWGVPRAPLVVALSEDDGLTFPFRRTLAVGTGYCLSNNSRDGLNRELSYPSIHQGSDGTINIAFTFYRRAIKHIRITEPWIASSSAR